MMADICIIGGTGFVGRHLLSSIRKHDPFTIVRILSRSSPLKPLPENVFWSRFDVTDPLSLKNALSGSEVIYYLPGILAETRSQSYEEVHYEGVVRTLGAIGGKGVRRFVHVSAVGAALNAPSAYHRTKKKAEEAVECSGLPYTIVRPSLVFGPGDRSINQFLTFARTFHVLPMIGPGKARVQPVFAGDLAEMLAVAPARGESAGKIYEVGGPRIYTYREMMESIRKSARLKAILFPGPVALLMFSAMLQKIFLSRPILTPDVIRMALSDNVTRSNALITDFRMTLTSLESYLESGAI
jgi:NADH dehydrogenase